MCSCRGTSRLGWSQPVPGEGVVAGAVRGGVAHPGCPGVVLVVSPLRNHAEAPHLVAVDVDEDFAVGVGREVLHALREPRASERRCGLTVAGAP